MFDREERSSCGVGFIVNRKGIPSHAVLEAALKALDRVEHRGACGADGVTGDGAGIMTDIPFGIFGYEPGRIAVATLFMPTDRARLRIARQVLEDTFEFMGLKVVEYRDVPCDESVLGAGARGCLPTIKHAIIQRPPFCRTDESFNRLLYLAKQRTRTRQKEAGIVQEFYFTSLSTTTIVYKALTSSRDLYRFYSDLRHPGFTTRFALFHRRFSTNTRTSWDKAQPFRLIAHNGEINTIAGNRAWALSREKTLGVPPDELLTHEGISDSGSLNEMVEALKYRSSIPRVEDLLAIMMPPADLQNSFYQFWARALEPWDGPALIAYSDGETIGARLDRNGFRPCRWTITDNHVFVASEAGVFDIDDDEVLEKGLLRAGRGLKVRIADGSFTLEDPSHSADVRDAEFDPRLAVPGESKETLKECELSKFGLFGYTQELAERVLIPMIQEGKEPIGSMGDTASIAIFSDQDRSFFDYFVHDFAQVTNPPLDYLRERLVTDLSTFLGPRPNIFAPKELIPPPRSILLSSPVLSMSLLQAIIAESDMVALITLGFRQDHGQVGLRTALQRIASEAVLRVQEGAGIIVLSDMKASTELLPVPSLLGLRAVVNALNSQGLNLSASIVVESGEIVETHHVAALLGFGATAVCPALSLAFAEQCSYPSLVGTDPCANVKKLISAYESGLLKIMSKSGISVARSYQGSELFTPLGLHQELLDEFFPRKRSRIGGLTLSMIAQKVIARSSSAELEPDRIFLPSSYQYKEHTKGTKGERHSMTNLRSRIVQRMVRENGEAAASLYSEYLEDLKKDYPVAPRHLLKARESSAFLSLDDVEPASAIMSRFGSGAMSFGAISAESQRDLFDAMKRIGGRSNSGEGGENPYYFLDGTLASIKQVASGRFGVTAEYLVTAAEFQIKIGQGAKPGEGGQLMGVKVGRDIARARHSDEQVDLISPPPQHDIYSIEDLKQLIHDLKSFRPETTVSVKLVSGTGIGTIAVGVAKAGADVIHISGWDGGTGASPLSSMKHAGLPWELGLVDVHAALVENDLREFVRLRVDGGIHTGADIIIASLLGAEEFDFGKLLLVAEGCVMARICEKNRCPAGIATHDPKFKAKYAGIAGAIVRLLELIAEDVRVQLGNLGFRELSQICGRSDLLEVNPDFEGFCHDRHLDLSDFLQVTRLQRHLCCNLNVHRQSPLNVQILKDCIPLLDIPGHHSFNYPISNEDRSIGAPLSAAIAARVHQARMDHIASSAEPVDTYGMSFLPPVNILLNFKGSAGQGFGVFLTDGVSMILEGEANDSVGKGMSGGNLVITPPKSVRYRPETNVIIGNCALYGATGGMLFAHGIVGDRFAVRNSGAIAVVEGAGLHLCEYMTRGVVVVLGEISQNIGAGMTGGTIYILDEYASRLNREFVSPVGLGEEDELDLKRLLTAYGTATGSGRIAWMLSEWKVFRTRFVMVIPNRRAEKLENAQQNFDKGADDLVVLKAG